MTLYIIPHRLERCFSLLQTMLQDILLLSHFTWQEYVKINSRKRVLDQRAYAFKC